MAANTGAVTKTGTIGQGAESTTISGSTQNIGAGLGATGEDGVGYGPEFTVTFSTNPGILKSIELDTREINNKGTPEYWVANVRQGQFHSRYSHNLGRVNTLIYGSKLLYTNSDWSTAAPQNTMVKIGGQEAVVAATPGAHAIELSEPYLGASILPVTTDVGTTASAIAASSITVVAPGTTIIANHLKSGAKLMVGGCPIYSDDTAVAVTDTSVSIVAHDCHTDITTSAQIVYRRSDDPSNQNLYKTTGDTAAPTQSLQLVRGSPNVYIVDASITDLVKQYAGATSTFTTSATTATIAANDAFFVNGRGPMKAGTGGLTGSKILAVKSGEAGIDGPESLFAADFSSADTKFPIAKAVSDTKNMHAGSILQLSGRRYKVKSIGTTAGSQTNNRVTLTENWAGGQLLEVCSSCITAGTAASPFSLTSSKKVTLAKHDKILVGGYVHEDLQITVDNAITDATAITISEGANTGKPAAVASGTLTTAASLYRVLHGHGYTGYKVTESATATTFQYVSQCSNRGSCDSSTGICKCFKGYSNDNCDNQNMLAM
jgi:hypothetical protein